MPYTPTGTAFGVHYVVSNSITGWEQYSDLCYDSNLGGTTPTITPNTGNAPTPANCIAQNHFYTHAVNGTTSPNLQTGVATAGQGITPFDYLWFTLDWMRSNNVGRTINWMIGSDQFYAAQNNPNAATGGGIVSTTSGTSAAAIYAPGAFRVGSPITAYAIGAQNLLDAMAVIEYFGFQIYLRLADPTNPALSFGGMDVQLARGSVANGTNFNPTTYPPSSYTPTYPVQQTAWLNYTTDILRVLQNDANACKVIRGIDLIPEWMYQATASTANGAVKISEPDAANFLDAYFKAAKAAAPEFRYTAAEAHGWSQNSIDNILTGESGTPYVGSTIRKVYARADYYDMHIYGSYPKTGAGSINTTELANEMVVAEKLDKPWMVGECGVVSQSNGFGAPLADSVAQWLTILPQHGAEAVCVEAATYIHAQTLNGADLAPTWTLNAMGSALQAAHLGARRQRLWSNTARPLHRRQHTVYGGDYLNDLGGHEWPSRYEIYPRLVLDASTTNVSSTGGFIPGQLAIMYFTARYPFVVNTINLWVQTAGLASPSTAGSVALASGGTLTVGTAVDYQWAYSWASGATSAPTVSIGTVTPTTGNQTASLSSLPTSYPSGANGLTIYRRTGGTGGYFQVGTTTTSTFSDNGIANGSAAPTSASAQQRVGLWLADTTTGLGENLTSLVASSTIGSMAFPTAASAWSMSLSAPYQLIEGQRYGVTVLMTAGAGKYPQVMATQLAGNLGSLLAPVISKASSSAALTDLPSAPFNVASMANNSNNLWVYFT